MYLRDARHLDKFMYTLRNPLFYEPYEASYQPAAEYKAIAQNLLDRYAQDWSISPQGYWTHVHPKQIILPKQGWKIHVSATILNGSSILDRAGRVALTNGIPFKFAADKNILSLFSSKRWSRGGSGKFLTVYPSSVPVFKDLLEQLYQELYLEKGPYILSDRRYRDCGVLYYRYGGITPVSRLAITGTRVPILQTPDGEFIPDVRSPYFLPPIWEADPFMTQEEEPKQLALGNGRFQIRSALAFSNSGGVYLAEDAESGTEVVVKEARAHTLVDLQGGDAISLLKKEFEILRVLEYTGVAPKPLQLFQEWENSFLAQEFLSGVDIRELMLTRSPLMLVKPTLTDSVEFYDTFSKIFKSLLFVVRTLHEHGIVFGDLSANNIKIDPLSLTVRIIDFEGAVRPGLDASTPTYTPGFRDPLSLRKASSEFSDDLYGVAAIMFYLIFPIHALSSSRPDLYTNVLRTIVKDLGWEQTNTFEVISGLAYGNLSIVEAEELLQRQVHFTPPSYTTDGDDADISEMIAELRQFLVANMHVEKQWLFDADPFMHETNFLSLGFGAGGVLYAFQQTGIPLDSGLHWLQGKVDRIGPQTYPPGLLTGTAGVAMCLLHLGDLDRAVGMIKMANESDLSQEHHSYLYGMAGLGIANLAVYLKTNDEQYLRAAQNLGEVLLKKSKIDERGLYWESEGLVQLGLGYGQSGVALFLLRLTQISGDDVYYQAGKRALDFDLSYGVEIEDGVTSFPRSPADTTLEPYLEEGSAGIARVAIRYGLWERVDQVLADLERKYTLYPGLLYGLGSCIDVLTDAYVFSGNKRYLDMAEKPIAGLKDLYFLKQECGSATPGDGLLRLSCDYATGVAGTLRALHRHLHPGPADFMLDLEVAGLANSSVQIAPSTAYVT